MTLQSESPPYLDAHILPEAFIVVAHTAPAAVAVTIPARVTLKELSPLIQRPVPQPISN